MSSACIMRLKNGTMKGQCGNLILLHAASCVAVAESLAYAVPSSSRARQLLQMAQPAVACGDGR